MTIDLVTLEELSARGLTRSAIAHLVRTGRLHRKHRGVYVWGRPDLPYPGHIRAAVLACGPRALSSFHASAGLWTIAPSLPLDAAVDVTVVGTGARSRPGIVVHRARIKDADRRTRHGVPCTSPPRTLLDLAAITGPDDLEQLVVEADIRKLASADELDAVIRRYPTHQGVAALRGVREAGAWRGLTRSQAERLMLDLVRRAHLQTPRVNPMTAEHRIDFAWDLQRLVVEVDGFATHARRRAFENDHARDAALELAGWHVLRFTARQLQQTPELVIATLATALARRGEALRP